MFDASAFIKRLEKLMDDQQLSASAFADVLGVQRSGISHILSGRNKPGLEFILKITDAFPNTDLYWLLKGEKAKERNKEENRSPLSVKPADLPGLPKNTEADVQMSYLSKVIVLHPDGTFSEYMKRP